VNLLPPRVLGPLSECGRSVIVANAIPGATVTLVVKRGGVDLPVGRNTLKGSKGTIPLDPAESLVGGDLVNAAQELNGDHSANSTDGPEVQKSVAQFDAIQVLSHLHQCSRGFFVGGMRPGTQVQLLQGGSVIGTGVAVDGTASVAVPDGIPLVVAGVLTARQVICPKPPPPPPSSSYTVDSPLPAVDASSFHQGQTLPAPTIAQGLTGCSRSVQVTNIQAGAEVSLEGKDRGWWAYLGPSDQTSAWLPLPVELKPGEAVTIHQEVAPRCELTFERKTAPVGPQKKLDKPGLASIDCNATPTIYVFGLKPEANLEISVTPKGGTETVYQTVVTETDGAVPAPPMPVDAVVRVRQGECSLWSDWSDKQTAKAMNAPPQTPKISHELFSCQNAVPVENIFPLIGYLRVVSTMRGELNRVYASGNVMVIPVAPSLTTADDVWVEHHVCKYTVPTARKTVRQARDVVPGTIKAPLYDGDTTVTITGAIAGAHMELWEETKNQLLQQVRAPFSDTDSVAFDFSGFGALQSGWKVYAKTWHCGHYVQTQPSVGVGLRAPSLSSIVPSSALVGSAGFVLTLKGSNFRAGAKGQWNSVDRTTTFVSATELHVTIPATDVATAKSIAVRVVNPDGQPSGSLTFTVNTPAPAGYDDVLIQNCNTSTDSDGVHRSIYIWYRRTDPGAPGDWTEIEDSPHEADYDASGQCPASASSGASFSLDNGATYEIVCTDPELPGCMNNDPDEVACRRLSNIVVHGKTGGGTKIVRVT